MSAATICSDNNKKKTPPYTVKFLTVFLFPKAPLTE